MIQRPRRLVALVSLLLSSTAAASLTYAQGKADYDSSKKHDAPRHTPQKVPLGMSKERQLWLFERACGSSVSSWESRGDRVICTDFAASGRPYHRNPRKDVTLFKARLSDPTDDIDALKRAVNEEDATVSFHSGPRPTGPARKGCFLTESCCDEVGLSDDCFELTALRRYRDRVLAIRPEEPRRSGMIMRWRQFFSAR